MKTLHIDVLNKIATYRSRDGIIVCGNSDYQIQFTFDSMWDEYDDKNARFIWNNQYIDVPFSGDICDVPVITDANEVTIGVYAGDIRTTTGATINCQRSILCGGARPNPETDKNYASEAQEAAKEAKAYAELAATYVPKDGKDGRDGVDATPVTPLFVNKIEECTDTTMPYVLPDGYIYAYMLTEKVVGGYENLLEKATDTDKTTIYNGTGYKDGERISSSGAVSTLSGAFLTGLMPVKVGETIYLNGNYIKTDWESFGSANSRFYDDELNGVYGPNMAGFTAPSLINIVTNDEGYITQFTLNPDHTYNNWQTVASFLKLLL